MLRKKKLNLEKDTLEHQVLKQMIHTWLAAQRAEIADHFRVPAKRMKELQPQFQQKCLQYTVLRRLPWVFPRLSQQTVILLNTDLKKNYQRLIINAFFTADNTFELFIFYLVKLAAQFLKENFSNLLVDITLQSQICIVLYFTFLGLEMKEKTYEIIKRKYQKPKARFEDRSLKTSKNSLFQSYLKQSNKIASNNRLLKSRHSIHWSRQSICKPLKESFLKDNLNDNISSILKDNLHVAPLPPLKERKVRIGDLQKMKTEGGEEMDYCFCSGKENGGRQATLPKKCYLLSNQLSSSLKTLHPEQLLFELTSPQIKISQSFHRFTNNRQDPLALLHRQKDQLKQSFHQKQSQVRNELKTSSDWMSIIGSLKKKVFGMRYNSVSDEQQHKQSSEADAEESERLTHFASNEEETAADPNPSLLMPNQQPSADGQQLLFYPKKPEQNSSLKIENYQQCKQGSQGAYWREKKFNKVPITRKSIRQDQELFESTCKARLTTLVDIEQQNESIHWEWRRHRFRQ